MPSNNCLMIQAPDKNYICIRHRVWCEDSETCENYIYFEKDHVRLQISGDVFILKTFEKARKIGFKIALTFGSKKWLDIIDFFKKIGDIEKEDECH